MRIPSSTRCILKVSIWPVKFILYWLNLMDWKIYIQDRQFLFKPKRQKLFLLPFWSHHQNSRVFFFHRFAIAYNASLSAWYHLKDYKEFLKYKSIIKKTISAYSPVCHYCPEQAFRGFCKLSSWSPEFVVFFKSISKSRVTLPDVPLQFATWKHLKPRVKVLDQTFLAEVIQLGNKPSTWGEFSQQQWRRSSDWKPDHLAVIISSSVQNTVKIGRNFQAMNALAHKHSAGAMLGCYFQYALAGRQTLTTAKQLQARRGKKSF